MSNGDNHPNLKKQITSIAFVVGACLVGLIALLSYLGRSGLTPVIANHVLNISKVVETALKQDVEYKKLIDNVRELADKAAESADKAQKSEQKVMAIKNEMKSQLRDVDTAYFKMFVFQNEKGNTGQQIDRGLHFFADGTQRVSVRFWCDRKSECAHTFFKIKIDQANLFKNAPYYSRINGSELTAEADNYLPPTLIPKNDDMGTNKRTLTVVPDVPPGHKFKKRVELFCWVSVRHKGVPCD